MVMARRLTQPRRSQKKITEEDHRRRSQKKITEEDHRRRSQKKITEEDHMITSVQEEPNCFEWRQWNTCTKMAKYMNEWQRIYSGLVCLQRGGCDDFNVLPLSIQDMQQNA
ncbi:hypothetical protein OS493_011696 [Desmophyllum pertusum]|uniref:Uncharacterized protein n=1 Tax=Desmophyllum pertusum TaxID=174260 RepID=A0A9W9YFE9_9CNID|nr:hypothetical protein OS493_011696 [Desmophyllum pertusum]